MMSTAPPLLISRNQANRLQSYIQTYRHYAFASIAPSTGRNNTLRILQAMQGRLIELMDQQTVVLQLALTAEEVATLKTITAELLMLYAKKPATSERIGALADLASLKSCLKGYYYEDAEIDNHGAEKEETDKQQATPCFVFTLETVMLAQKALQLFEQSLGKVKSQPAKVEFAAAIMQQVKGKLEAMQISVGLMCLATFDYNEKIVLAAAIQLYTLDLLTAPFNARRQRELRQRHHIERFALDYLTTERERNTHD